MQIAKERWGEAEILDGAEDNGELYRKLLDSHNDREQLIIEREPKLRDTKKCLSTKAAKQKRKNKRAARRKSRKAA